MAIYCWRCSVITRSKVVDGREVGSSAVAASAYRSGREMYDERRQEREDYSRRHGIVRDAGEVLLPDNAPDEYRDREVLWNAVEEAERAHNAQLAREIVIAMPVELLDADRTYDAIAQLGHDYAQMLADQGMCVQWDLHDPDNADRNPHIHILATMRGIDEDGNWMPKTHKEYLLRDPSGELDDRYANSQERAQLRDEGWQDVYSYRDHGSRLRLTADEAADRGLTNADRSDRHPVSRKADENDWNTPERFEQWRRSWEDMCNERLREIGREDQEISRLSYQERGIDRVPTIHEGSWVCEREREAMERAQLEGSDYVPVTDIRTANLIIAETNEQIAELERDPIPSMEQEVFPQEQEQELEQESWQQRAMVRELIDHGWQARNELLRPREATLEERDDGQSEREAALEQHRTFMDEVRERIEYARELAREAIERAREMLRELPDQVREMVRTVEDLVREHSAQRAGEEHEREEHDRPMALDRGDDGDERQEEEREDQRAGDEQEQERSQEPDPGDDERERTGVLLDYERAVDAYERALDQKAEIKREWEEMDPGPAKEEFDGLPMDYGRLHNLDREIPELEQEVDEMRSELEELREHPIRHVLAIREQVRALEEREQTLESKTIERGALQERIGMKELLEERYNNAHWQRVELDERDTAANQEIERAKERVYEVYYDRMDPQEREQAREEIHDPGPEPIWRTEARQRALEQQREQQREQARAEERINKVVRVCWNCHDRDLTPEEQREVERVVPRMEDWEMEEVHRRVGYVPDSIDEVYERSHGVEYEYEYEQERDLYYER